MKQPSDTWYVRFPDGRVVRAPNTMVVRQHLDSGHIPWNSRVRRSDEEEWTALDWTQEFADLIPPASNPNNANASHRREPVVFSTGQPLNLAARLDPARLHVIGIRGLVDELLAALENTLSRPKLTVAGLMGVLGGAVVAVAGSLNALSPPAWSWALWGAAALLMLLVGVVGIVWLTQMTYIELCQLRPVRWAEARVGQGRFSTRLLIALLITAGIAGLGIALLRWGAHQAATIPRVEPEQWTGAPAIGLALASALTLVGEMLLWPVIGFALLLGPVVVIEECSLLTALQQWWRLVRRHLGRLFLYEGAAALIGLAPLSFAVPLALAAWVRWDSWKGFDTAFGFSLSVLAGLVLAPLIAYLVVVQVFIYINLRYEVDSGPR
jgi:hypothetical protein